ncbi:MAG: SRPBCC family protein [Arenimonas sp.]
MQEVRVTHEFNFDIEKVFAGISNHVEFLSTSKIECSMLCAGECNANGKGALRKVQKGMICFEEEINAFDPPHSYEYRILSLRGPFNLKLPFRHQLGRLELHAANQKTLLIWTSQFAFAVPLIGQWIERRLGKSISSTFMFFLKRLDTRLENDSGRSRANPL